MDRRISVSAQVIRTPLISVWLRARYSSRSTSLFLAMHAKLLLSLSFHGFPKVDFSLKPKDNKSSVNLSLLETDTVLGFRWTAGAVYISSTSLAFVLTGCLSMASLRLMARYRDDIKYEEDFVVNSRGNRLFTCRWMPKKMDSKALIFICHGYGGECSVSMGDTAARLVHSGYAVYGIDHGGHGKSSGSKGYISDFSDIIKDCSDYFKSICEKPENRSKKRFLYGFSMGGTVVLQLHRRDPLYWDGAVLLAPMCKISDDMRPPSFVVSALKMISAVAPSWRVIPAPDMIDKVCKDPQFKKEIRSNPYMYRGNLALQTGRELLMMSLDIEKNLQEVSLPFLVLHGEDDIVADPSGSKLLHERASSRDKTLKLYPGMWHVLMGERPEDVDRVFADVISWLEDRAGGAAELKEMKARDGQVMAAETHTL